MHIYNIHKLAYDKHIIMYKLQYITPVYVKLADLLS